MIPKILISCNVDHTIPAHRLHFAYADAIYAAGCLPIIVPAPVNQPEAELAAWAAEQLEPADGLLLTGGGDVEPWRFGERSLGFCGDREPRRDAWELALCAEAHRRGLPILGICRGHQLINISFGGSVVEDISLLGLKSDAHRLKPFDATHHAVRVTEERLAQHLGCRVGDEVAVNSSHHQALGRLGDGLIAAGFSAEGIIEAIIGSGHQYVLGVQWHPEHLLHTATSQALFASFATACGKK